MDKQAKIIVFSCLYVIGILAAFSKTMFVFGIVFLAVILFLHLDKKKFSIGYTITLMLIFVIALLNANFHLKHDDDLTPYTENNVILNAKVVSIPSNNIKNRTKFYATAQSIEINDYKRENLKAKTIITINDSQEKIQTIKIGDTLKLKGKLKEPISATNPSQFDYARYLQNKNTFSLLYVNAEWEILSNATDFQGKLIRKLNDTRNKILDIHRENIKSPMIEILGGIIFGDDAVNPDEETKESFIKSGIFHILAASGMNVTLIFGIWFFFARTLRLHYKFSILTGIFLIFIYTCMTGFGPPIIRAFLMLTLILIGKLIDRDTSTLSLLFIVGFLMLIYNPLMIYDIGFQLSFIVTFALIITAPLIEFNTKNKVINYTLGACMIPIIAQLYAAPLQMYYFNTFSLYSVFANIAIIPVLSFVSFVGFISSILALIPIWAKQICYIADFILNPFLIFIVKVADFFSSLPLSVITVKKPLFIQLIIYFTILITLTYLFRNKIKNKKINLIIGTLILCFSLTFLPPLKTVTEIIFFSVGNADATLIKSPQNKYYLIDTGKLPYNANSSQADYIIIKYLKDRGIKKLDGLILSHFDADHAGGTLNILKKLNVKKIYLSNSYEDTQLSNQIFDFINEHKINHTVVNKEIVVTKENKFILKLLKPENETLKTENEKSIITLLQTKNKKVLFMGDGNINTYNALNKEYKTDINVLKAGHHGAEDAINQEILNNTDFVVISTGPNIYNHPHENTIKLLEQNNKEFYRTDYHNAIKIVIDDEIKKYFYSPRNSKYLP